MNNERLQADLEAKVGEGEQFVMANDANSLCAGEAEATLGAARGFSHGVWCYPRHGRRRAAVVVNGQVLNGCHGIAGEWGQFGHGSGGAGLQLRHARARWRR